MFVVELNVFSIFEKMYMKSEETFKFGGSEKLYILYEEFPEVTEIFSSFVSKISKPVSFSFTSSVWRVQFTISILA